MVDVFKLQKMSNLAKTLKQQGLASNSEDALSAASTIIGSKENDEVLVREMDQQELDPNQQQLSQFESQPQPKQDGLSKEVVETALQSMADHFKQELTLLEQKMNEQKNMIIHLTRKLQQQENEHKGVMQESVTQQLQQEPVQKVVEKTVEHVQQVEQQPSHTAVAQAFGQSGQQSSPSDSHARSGGYESDDVSIEKFFYFGK